MTAAGAAAPRPALLAVALAAGVGLLYAPVRRYGFVSFDDPEYVTDNPHVTGGLTLDGIAWAFGTTHAANWHPLTWLSHMLDWELYGAWAGGHHLTSVAGHAASAALVLWILHRMTGAPWRSAVVAALFALHPLRVESVAWIAERKDVLCTLGWLVATWAWLRHLERPSLARYALTAVAFAGALLAKPMAVTLPFALLLLDVWPLGRAGPAPSLATLAPLVREKLPLFAMSAAASVATYAAQAEGGAVATLAGVPLGVRAQGALVAYAAYLRKTVWPTDLAFFYPRPAALAPGAVAAAAALLAALTAVALRLRRTRPYLLVGWLWFVGTLVPVIGLVRAGDQAMADRFTYVPSIGLLAALVWAAADALRARPVVGAGVAAAAIAGCAVASAGQLATWRDNRALYGHALRVTERNAVAHGNLGLELLAAGDAGAALEHFRRAREADPTSAKAELNLGVGLAALGRREEALAHYAAAVRHDPAFARAHFNWGATLVELDRLPEAVARYEEALRLDPGDARAHAGLGLARARQGRFEDAAAAYRTALRLDPRLAEAHANLGVALERLGAREQAIAAYEAAVRLAPDDPRTRFNLGAALQEAGRPADAVAHYRAAVRLAPALPEAHAGLGDALRVSGDAGGALAAYREALRLRPGWPEVAARADALAPAAR